MSSEAGMLLQFSFFIVFALLGTVVSMKLRQPYVVGLLIFGMIAGPNVLGLINDTSLIKTFSELGAVLLLFAVGIEFSIARVIRSGFRAVAITAFKMMVLFFFGYEISLYFGQSVTTSLFVGAMISITSTAILYKIVSQKGMAKHTVMPLLFSMLIVEDVAAVAALTFFSSLGGSTAFQDQVYSLFVSLGLLGGFYLLVRKHMANAILRMTSTFNEEIMIFVSFSLCLVMSMVAGFLGLSPAIGAFLAGSIVASLQNSHKIEKTIKPLLLMFASLFFLSLGMMIDPSVVLANFWFAAAITTIFVIACFLSVYLLIYLTGSKSTNAVFGASAMVVMGEFSLLIAASAKGPDAPLLLSIGSFGVIVTAIVSSFLLDAQGALLGLKERLVPRRIKDDGRALSSYFTGLIRDFSPNGHFWKAARFCWSCASIKLGKAAFIALLIVLSRLAVNVFAPPGFTMAGPLKAALLLMGIFPILYLLFGVLMDIKPVLDAMSRTIARHKKNAKTERVILRDILVVAVLLLASLEVHGTVAYLKLPGIFNYIDEGFFLIVIVFIWDIILHMDELRKRRKAARANG